MGRVGLGRVNAVLCLTRPKPHSFFRSARTIAPFTAHFVLLAEVLEQALLSLDKLSENSLAKKKLRCRIQESTNIFFRVSSGATYYERDKMNAITRGVHNNLI